MEFVDEALDELRNKSKRSIPLSGAILPEANDVFFRAKQKEIISQYQGARIFLCQTDTACLERWIGEIQSNGRNDAEIVKNNYRAYFYEAALMYYNIIIDLSWVMLYTAVEYRCKVDGVPIDITGIQPISKAYKALRDMESSTTKPEKASTNAFNYLKRVYPNCGNAVDMITSFWNNDGNSEIRELYNFCKHRGKLLYKEIEELQGGALFSIRISTKTINNFDSSVDRLALREDEYEEIVSDTNDVQKRVSLVEEIERLRRFDNEALHPYVKKLFDEIERIVKPSPMVVS